MRVKLLFLGLLMSVVYAKPYQDRVNILRHDHFIDNIDADQRVSFFGIDVKYVETFYSFMNGAPMYKTKMLAKLKVKHSEDLNKYAFVQYIRGCHFYSKHSSDGEIHYKVATSRDHFDQYIKFKHPNWVIDSVNNDPVYWSSQQYGRTGLYRLDNPQVTEDLDNSQFLFRDLKDHTTMFVDDMPAGAGSNSSIFGELNSSMEFKMCLYLKADLPAVTNTYGSNILVTPLKCFNWENKYVYDYQDSRFKVGGEIHPFCLE